MYETSYCYVYCRYTLKIRKVINNNITHVWSTSFSRKLKQRKLTHTT